MKPVPVRFFSVSEVVFLPKKKSPAGLFVLEKAPKTRTRVRPFRAEKPKPEEGRFLFFF
jgi:hypothetical protein